MGTVAKLKAAPKAPAGEGAAGAAGRGRRPPGAPLSRHAAPRAADERRAAAAALKDYAIQRWAFQAHANPAMMLSHAAFLEGDDVEHLLENAYDEIFRLAGEGDHPGLWVQFAKLLGATDAELEEAARQPLAEVIGFPRTMTHYCRQSAAEGLRDLVGRREAAARSARRDRARAEEVLRLQRRDGRVLLRARPRRHRAHRGVVRALRRLRPGPGRASCAGGAQRR